MRLRFFLPSMRRHGTFGAVILSVLAGSAFAAVPGESTNSRPSDPRTAAASPRVRGEHDAYRQVQTINERVSETWEEYGLSPSRSASDGKWCRRIYLDLLGRIPSVEELMRFDKSRSATKKSDLVGQLLYEQPYVEQYARNWATLWTNILIGRDGGSERNSLTSRAGLESYLLDAFMENKAYDRLVYELVTSTGVNQPDDPDFNGAVNFLTNKLAENAVEATAETAKVFLGMQVQCTQCHNHPFNSWKQNQFWELNAFFRQTVALRRFVRGTNDVRAVELTNQDFAGEGRSPTPENAELYYELRNGILQTAYPTFVDGIRREGYNSGYLAEVNRREELGKLIIQSDEMPRAIVNRVWAHFLGHGFTKPLDDMGPHNPSSHPDLVEYLSREFRDHQFDLKQLIQWIVLSRPYSLSSRISASNAIDDPLTGESPKFSRFYLRQMRAEELYESLLVATEAHKTRRDVDEQDRVRQQWLRQFVIAFGTDEGDETTLFDGTIPQTLMMFNGDLIQQATSSREGSFLSRIASSDLRPGEKIDHLFLTALARKPTRREIQAANRLLLGHQGDTTMALQDLWWAVLNSNEFILNH